MKWYWKIMGDSALTIYLEDHIDPMTNAHVVLLKDNLLKQDIKGVRAIVSTYHSVSVFFYPTVFRREELLAFVHSFFSRDHLIDLTVKEIVEIPVDYCGEDMEFVSKHTGLSVEEIILKHTAPIYRIYMIGFTPGFPYLGGMDPKLATPRRKTPRLKVAAGSVGIADHQTGIYSVDSPGGWQIIGKTKVKLFDAESKNPFYLRAGQWVKFSSI